MLSVISIPSIVFFFQGQMIALLAIAIHLKVMLHSGVRPELKASEI